MSWDGESTLGQGAGERGCTLALWQDESCSGFINRGWVWPGCAWGGGRQGLTRKGYKGIWGRGDTNIFSLDCAGGYKAYKFAKAH